MKIDNYKLYKEVYRKKLEIDSQIESIKELQSRPTSLEGLNNLKRNLNEMNSLRDNCISILESYKENILKDSLLKNRVTSKLRSIELGVEIRFQDEIISSSMDDLYNGENNIANSIKVYKYNIEGYTNIVSKLLSDGVPSSDDKIIEIQKILKTLELR